MLNCKIFVIVLIALTVIIGCKKKIITKFENGTIKEKYYVVKSDTGYVKDGNYVSYYNTGKKLSEIQYTNGKKTEKAVQWHENGQKKIECNYILDTLHGIYLSWYDNGKRKVECIYSNGKLDGKYVSYYDNGKNKIECEYETNKLVKKYISWHQSGKKHIECIYKDDEMVGDYIYHSDRKILNVHINSLNKNVELHKGVSFISDLINHNIKNAKAYIDKTNGKLIIQFDYLNQAWPFRVDRQGIADKMEAKPLLIRLFDKHDNYLKHFTTYELWMPWKVITRLKKMGYKGNLGTPYDTPFNLKRVKGLKMKANTLKYKLNAQIIDYATTIEVGFSTYDQVISSKALRKPPYYNKTEERKYKKKYYYVF